MAKSKKIHAEMITKKTTATAIALLASVIALPVYAAEAGRRRELKSEGIIEYTNGEQKVLIDSGDLYYLADEIDSLETAAKWGTLQAIQALPDAAASAGLAGKTAADIPNLTFSELNGAIRSSQQSASAPAAAEILSGKTAWANGQKITGSMRNNGATGASNLNAGRSYSIPAGYTTGGTVTTASLASQTAATATAANISSGKTAWVNGQLVTGTGGDNNSFYEQGRTAGYEQGVEAGRAEAPSLSSIDLTTTPTPNSKSMSWRLTGITGYKNLVLWNNLFPRMTSCLDMDNWNTSMSRDLIIDWSYDASTGILTVSSSNDAVMMQYGTDIKERTVRIYYILPN